MLLLSLLLLCQSTTPLTPVLQIMKSLSDIGRNSLSLANQCYGRYVRNNVCEILNFPFETVHSLQRQLKTAIQELDCESSKDLYSFIKLNSNIVVLALVALFLEAASVKNMQFLFGIWGDNDGNEEYGNLYFLNFMDKSECRIKDLPKNYANFGMVAKSNLLKAVICDAQFIAALKVR
eukprot:NODE_224_length_12322_cov_0.795549.p9 type:complete len:178 gc:universal NODE_224_length_12322_cov_0.795549:246-779(+)